MKLLITGASGFIGRALIAELSTQHHYIIYAAVRKFNTKFSENIKQIIIDDINYNSDWSVHLQNIDCIIHTAARVHVMSESKKDAFRAYREINTDATLHFARQAEQYGVKKFIYLSSIKVNGESTLLHCPFTPDDTFIPSDPYALSKYQAEQGLLKLANNSSLQVAIIRPPLVYGPEVKANFLAMMKLLDKKIPLPFGAINNKRSLVSITNLIDFIITCIHHTAAINQIFLIADGEDLSTTELLSRLSIAIGSNTYLIPFKHKHVEKFLHLIGKENLATRLCCSLQLDISKANKILQWTAPISVDEGLKNVSEYFLNSQR